MFGGPYIDLLERLAGHKMFLDIRCAKQVAKDEGDQELVLRFFALWRIGDKFPGEPLMQVWFSISGCGGLCLWIRMAEWHALDLRQRVWMTAGWPGSFRPPAGFLHRCLDIEISQRRHLAFEGYMEQVRLCGKGRASALRTAASPGCPPAPPADLPRCMHACWHMRPATLCALRVNPHPATHPLLSAGRAGAPLHWHSPAGVACVWRERLPPLDRAGQAGQEHTAGAVRQCDAVLCRPDPRQDQEWHQAEAGAIMACAGLAAWPAGEAGGYAGEEGEVRACKAPHPAFVVAADRIVLPLLLRYTVPLALQLLRSAATDLKEATKQLCLGKNMDGTKMSDADIKLFTTQRFSAENLRRRKELYQERLEWALSQAEKRVEQQVESGKVQYDGRCCSFAWLAGGLAGGLPLLHARQCHLVEGERQPVPSFGKSTLPAQFRRKFKNTKGLKARLHEKQDGMASLRR